jgi:hypothetical protein
MDGVARTIPQSQADGSAFRIGPAVGMIVEGLVTLSGAAQEFNFFRVEHAARQHVAIAAVLFQHVFL